MYNLVLGDLRGFTTARSTSVFLLPHYYHLHFLTRTHAVRLALCEELGSVRHGTRSPSRTYYGVRLSPHYCHLYLLTPVTSGKTCSAPGTIIVVDSRV